MCTHGVCLSPVTALSVLSLVCLPIVCKLSHLGAALRFARRRVPDRLRVRKNSRASSAWLAQ